MRKNTKQKCWFVEGADSHIETGFAGLNLKNVHKKLCLFMREKTKVKLLVCIYAVKAKTKMLVSEERGQSY